PHARREPPARGEPGPLSPRRPRHRPGLAGARLHATAATDPRRPPRPLPAGEPRAASRPALRGPPLDRRGDAGPPRRAGRDPGDGGRPPPGPPPPRAPPAPRGRTR